MCGACGAPATVWTERVAPLDGRAVVRRARALTALLAASGRAGRGVRVAPRPGGAWWLHRPGGDAYARTLPDALTELTRRLGPLVPGPDGGPPPTSPAAGPQDPVPRRRHAAADAAEAAPGRAGAVTLAGDPGRDAAAVWCAAVRAAAPRCVLTVVVAGHRVELAADGGVRVHPAAGLRPAVRGPGADGLAAHWVAWSSRVVDHPGWPGAPS